MQPDPTVPLPVPNPPTVVVVRTSDAAVKTATYTPFSHAKISLAPDHESVLYRYFSPGKPAIFEEVQHVLKRAADNTFFVFLRLREDGHAKYEWVNETQEGEGFYSEAEGYFQYPFAGLAVEPNPIEVVLPFESDTIHKHTTQAFEDYLNGFGGIPVENVTDIDPAQFGTSPTTYMQRYRLDIEEFTFVEEKIQFVFWKAKNSHVEWHLFLSARCIKRVETPPDPSWDLFGWTAVSAPGEFYANSGLLRNNPASSAEWHEQPLG